MLDKGTDNQTRDHEISVSIVFNTKLNLVTNHKNEVFVNLLRQKRCSIDLFYLIRDNEEMFVCQFVQISQF
jgi:hypothetical protein